MLFEGGTLIGGVRGRREGRRCWSIDVIVEFTSPCLVMAGDC